MKRTWKWIMLAAVVTLIAVLAACSKGDSNKGDGNTTSASPNHSTTPDADAGKPKDQEVTIKYWVDPRFQYLKGMEDTTENFGDFEQMQAEEFMKLYPNVKVEVEVISWEDLPKKIPVAISGGTAPDVLRDYLGRTGQYAYQGVLENLETLLPQEELDDYHQDYLDMYTINGHLHALPAYAWTSALVVNRELWKNKGQENLLPTNEDPYWTWEQFDTAIRAVAEKGEVFPLGLQVAQSQGDNGLLGFLWGFGAQLFKDGDYSKTALNSPEAVKALEYMIKLNDEGLLQPSAPSATGDEIGTLFERNKLGMYGANVGAWNALDNAKREGRTEGEFDLAIYNYPHAEGVKNGLPVGPTGLAVFKQNDDYKREMVIKFVQFLNNTEYQQIYAINSAQFPVKKSAGVPLADDEFYGVMQKMLEEQGLADMGLTHPKYAEFRVLLQPEIQAVLLKSKTPEQALADYEQAVNKILAN